MPERATDPAPAQHPKPKPKAKAERREPTRYIDPVFELEPFPFGD